MTHTIKIKKNQLYFVGGLVFALVLIAGFLALPKAEGEISFDQAIGKAAPDFQLETFEGEKISLSSLRGKNIVLFFNEGLMCYPACWNQIAALANDVRFNNDNTQAFSVVVDSKTQWQKAIAKMPELSSAKVLFDTKREVSSKYGVLSLESSMHPGSYPGHTYVVIDKSGIIRYALDDYKMGIWNDKIASEIQKLG